KIITRARFDKCDEVLEIGAGLGALTLPLARSVHKIFAVEKDSLLTDILRKKLFHAGIDNVILINDDILKLDFNKIGALPTKKIKVIGNLPYNLSSPLLEKLIKNRNLMTGAILMFQIELARRLISAPGSKEYGAISVLIQYHAHVSPLLEVPKENFYPRPKIDSMVLELDFERPYPRKAENEKNFRTVVKGAFAYRRKTLLNSLKRTLSSYSSEKILEALAKCAIESWKRAETLDIDDFLCLSSTLELDI
ncbi:MAG: ribosomal RNA small subunit methyltransferase A, partial [Deltaproteobacteria bacterium]|nr:ribosomal RNA small subunit methyltransferase A [Deltaproteobacteria bacterium]